MPEPGFTRDWQTHHLNLSIERSELNWGSLTATIGIAAWIGLLMTGIFACVRAAADRAFRAALAILIGGQLALHMAYGDEIFLYSLDFAPLLVILAGIGCVSRLRSLVLFMAIIAIPCAAVNNGRMFYRTVRLFHDDLVKPAGDAHMIVGMPHSADALKTIVESEGNFSPGSGSYGIYFWATEPTTGKLTAPTMAMSNHKRGLPEDGSLVPWAQWRERRGDHDRSLRGGQSIAARDCPGGRRAGSSVEYGGVGTKNLAVRGDSWTRPGWKPNRPSGGRFVQ